MSDEESDLLMCALCTKLTFQARYCLKCKTRSFCPDTCQNADIHSCFSTQQMRERHIKITALSKLLINSKKFQDIYNTLNKESRIRRRKEKYVLSININDSHRICDVVQNPQFYCGKALVTSLNELYGTVETFPHDWNNVMYIVMYKADDSMFIRVVPLP
jgi:hypothetical protein